MPSIKIPPELKEKLDELHELMSEKPEPLDSTPAGKEILSLLEEVQREIGMELKLFSRALGARQFHARIFIFQAEKKAKRLQWKLRDVQLGEPEFLPGGPKHLQKLLLGAMKHIGGKTIALWLHHMATPTQNDSYFAYLLHHEGQEATYQYSEGGWSPLPLGEGPRLLVMEMLLNPTSGAAKRWARVIEAQMHAMRKQLRDEVTAFVEKASAGMTDELWEEFLTMIYLRKEHLMLLQEASRMAGTSVLHEAQQLLSTTLQMVDKALNAHSEKLVHLEKNHARVLKRFKTDLDKFKLTRDAAANRANQLEREVQNLRKQLQASTTGPAREQEAESLGLSLDRFFMRS